MNTFVEPSYLLLGDGRLAYQFAEHFNRLKIPFLHWSRKRESASLCLPIYQLVCEKKDVVALLALSDGALETYSFDLRELGVKKIIHFSGSFNAPQAVSFHPLMSFSRRLLSSEEFEAITFVGTLPELEFREIFPSFQNPYSQILEAERELYHANCVSAGNFANILWNKTLRDFEKMKIPSAAFEVYLKAVLANFFDDPDGSLTGPIVRGDLETIQKNLRALKSDFRSEVYLSFLRSFETRTALQNGEAHECT